MSICHTRLAIAVAMTISSFSALAANYTVTNPAGNNGYYAGLYNPQGQINESVTITQGDQPIDMERSYGFWVKGVDEKGIINGDTTLNAGGNYIQTIGVAAYQNGAVLDLSAGKTTISMTSSAPTFIRSLSAENTASLIVGKTDVEINVLGKINTSNKARYVQGLYVAKSTFNAKDDVSISINGFDEVGELVDLGSETYGTRIRAINIEGSGYNTDVTFDKNLAIAINAKTEEILGIFTSTDNAATDKLHSRLSIGGNLSVDIDGDAQKIYGVESQGEASIKSKNIGITINSRNSDAYVYGLAAISTKPDFEGVSGITVSEDLSISLKGDGKLHGLETLGTQSERQTGISVAGLTKIDVSATEGEAIALKLDGGSKVVLNHLQASVLLESNTQNSNSIGASVLNNSSLIVEGDA